MKKTINTLAITAAACLTLGGVAYAGSMGYPEERVSYTTTTTTTDAAPTYVTTSPAYVTTTPTYVTTTPTLTERRVVTTEPEVIGERDTFGERVVTLPGRTASTVVRSPLIIGETVTGRRAVVSDQGLFAPGYRTVTTRRLSSRPLFRTERVVVRDSDTFRTVPARRLSSRTIYRTESTPGLVARRTGYAVATGAEATGRGIVRTGRTVVRTPLIIGETMTGQRRVISNEGRPFAPDRY